jgi:hypothetical protein
MTGQWQLRFDGGRQQRYLPDRRSVLRYVLAIGGQAQVPVFEIWGEDEPVRLADGRAAGRRFVRVEVIDLRVEGAGERVRAELARLAGTGGPEGAHGRR